MALPNVAAVSRKHLQLEELGGLAEASIDTGQRQRNRERLIQQIGPGKLNAVIAAQRNNLGVFTRLFHQRLGEISDPKPGQLGSNRDRA